MGIYFENVDREAQQILDGSALGSRPHLLSGNESGELDLTRTAQKAVRLAAEHCRNFGQEQIEPEHLLMGIADLHEAAAIKILEELGVNMPFLWRQIMTLMARQYCSQQSVPSVKFALMNGVKELVSINEEAVRTLSRLAQKSRASLKRLPSRSEVVQMVLLGYLPDFLATQVTFQRYLLQESMSILELRSGPLDQELTATIVSNAAQNLRLEVRATIEHLWSHEYRMLDQILDEAEHDLIGSELEDLWWAQSEEMALHEMFDAALDDHRRKHVLSLQKGRIEITQRIIKLRARLSETIQQCLLKRSIPA